MLIDQLDLMKQADRVNEASMNILKMHTFGCKFLEVTFQVATDPQISCDIYDRIGAATQLKQSLSE